MDEDVFWRPARELRNLFASRALSPLEFAHATLMRIDRLNASYNAFITVNHEDVIAQARLAEEALSSPSRLGPLHGVPVSLSDTIPTANLRTTFGSAVFNDFIPQDDAVAVARLRAAGAIILGKTGTSEFALRRRTGNRLSPETLNPWREGFTAGGASGGAAASVALGMAPVGIGGDDGGSITLPAAFCGIYGLSPSAGRVPNPRVTNGRGYIRQLFRNTGPLTRDVGDAALVTRIMSGYHPSDPTSLRTRIRSDGKFGSVAGLRALWVTFTDAAANPTVIEHVRTAVDLLRDIRLRITDQGTLIDNGIESVDVLMRCHVGRYFRQLAADPVSRAMLTPESQDWAEQCTAQPVPLAEEAAAWRARAMITEHYAALFKDHDILLTPTFGDVAAPILAECDAPVSEGGWAAQSYGVTGIGLPNASVPCGFVDGLPVGLQIIAQQGRDDFVFDVSHAIEQRWPWGKTRPRELTRNN